MACPIYHPEDRAESAIRYVGLPSILYLKIGDLERTTREADLSTFVLVNLGAGRNVEIPLRIERIWVLPVDRIQAAAGVRRADITMAFQRRAKSLLRRGAIGGCSGIVNS